MPSPFENTRAELVPVALTHPGFAHVPANTLRGVIYSYINNSEGMDECHINWSIPMMRAFALSHIGKTVGAFCCLCNAIRREGGHRTSLPFCKWLCGDFDGSGVPAFRTHPLCGTCNAQVLLAAAHGQQLNRHFLPILAEADFPAVLCCIYGDRGFARRVEANAGNYEMARFDPRIDLEEAA